jgi:hypothetical protein
VEITMSYETELAVKNKKRRIPGRIMIVFEYLNRLLSGSIDDFEMGEINKILYQYVSHHLKLNLRQ